MRPITVIVPNTRRHLPFKISNLQSPDRIPSAAVVQRSATAVSAVPQSPNRTPSAAVVRRRFGLSGLLLAAGMTLIPSVGSAQDCLQWAERTPPAAYAQSPQGSIVGWGTQVVGVEVNTGDFYAISTTDASLQLIGHSGVAGLGALEFNPRDGFFYGFTTGVAPVLYRFNIPLTLDSITPTAIGPLNFFVFEGGLAFAADGTAYAMNGGVSVPYLFTVDLTTGQSTIVGSMQEGHDIAGLGWRSDGMLIGLDSRDNALLAINPANADATLIHTIAPIIGAVGGMALLGNTGYFVTAGPHSIFPGSNELYRFDPFTGEHSLIGSFEDVILGSGFSGLSVVQYGSPARGSIVAWGSNSFGQTDVPAPNADFIAVAAGGFHSLGLKADGSIVAWGGNDYRQSNVPAPNTGFVAVAAGSYDSLGLRGDGSIVAWGSNDAGQTNVPAPNADFIGIAAGYWHSLGLKADGTIVAWGCGSPNNYGQCNVPAANGDFIAVAAAHHHSLALKNNGSIVAWGCGGIYSDAPCIVPSPNTGFVGVAAGGSHSLGLKADGSIVAWGVCAGPNGDSQCHVPSPNSGFAAVAAGYWHSLGLKADGSIVAWGCDNPDNRGQCNVPAPNTGFVATAGGRSHSLAIRAVFPGLSIAPGGATDFGSVAVGTGADRGFTLRNTSFSPIVGNASAPAPFSVVSGASYTLAPGQTQAVTVRYSPTQPGSNIAYITFTGTGTQQRQLLGAAFTTPISGSVIGTVVEDDATAAATAGQPIAGAVVSIAGGRAVCAADGSFSVQGLLPGTYTLTATGPSPIYLTTDLPGLTITAGSTPQVLIKLPRRIVPPPPIPGQRNTPVLLVSGFGCTDPPWDTGSCNGDYCDFACDKSTWGNVRTALKASGFEFPNPDPVGHPEWDVGALVWDPNEPTPNAAYPLAGRILLGTERIRPNFVPNNSTRLKDYVTAKIIQFRDKQGYEPASIDIVASSMGGLITREFLIDRQLEVYPGTSRKLNLRVGKVIMLGTPNAGTFLADLASTETGRYLATHFGCPAGIPESVKDLTTDAGRNFHISHYPWPGDVQLFLLAGTSTSLLDCPKLWLGSGILTQSFLGHPNDGAVPRTSLLGIFQIRPTPQDTGVRALGIEDRLFLPFRLYKELPIDHLWLKQDTAAVAWIQCVLTSPHPESACGAGTPSYGTSTVAEAASPTGIVDDEVFVLAPGEGVQWVIPSDSPTTLSLFLSASDALTSATVQDPDGNVVPPTEVNADPWTQTYDVAAPTPGEWTVSFSLDPAATASAGVSVFAAGDGPVALIPTTEESILNSQNALVSCALNAPGKEPDAVEPVTGATVLVDVALPDGTTTQLALLDDGLHSDGLADDGTYAAVFTNTAQGGSYRLRYRADGTAAGLAFRRVALGTFGVSSAAARISGNLTDEPVDFDADGFADFLRVQFWVTAQQAGAYLASGLVVDETGPSSIAGSETALELPIGTSTVSVLFDCRKLAVPGTYGPFSLQNLELFERRDDQIAWVDRYREAYALATAQVEIPCPPFDGDCDGDRDLADFAKFALCFSGLSNQPGHIAPTAECRRVFDFNRDGDVDLADFKEFQSLFAPTPP